MKDGMDSKRQAALVWLSLSPEAKQVMQDRLGDFPEEVRVLAEELNAIESASREEVKVAIDGFYETRMENRYVRHGGHAQARAFVEGAVDSEEAGRIMAPIERKAPRRKPFSSVASKLGGAKLLEFIRDEHPQTLAVILSHLPTTQQQDVMAALETDLAAEVAQRIATMDRMVPETVALVEDALNSRLQTMTKSQAEEIGGADTVASMIGGLTPEQQVAILEQFEEPLRRQIQELLLKFEDLFALDGKEFEEVFTKGFTPPELALATYESPEQQDMVLANLGDKATTSFEEALDEYRSGRVKVKDVREKQAEIIKHARQLEQEGTISLGGDEEFL